MSFFPLPLTNACWRRFLIATLEAPWGRKTGRETLSRTTCIPPGITLQKRKKKKTNNIIFSTDTHPHPGHPPSTAKNNNNKNFYQQP